MTEYVVREHKICENCGTTFIRDAGSHQKYCSNRASCRHASLAPVVTIPTVTREARRETWGLKDMSLDRLIRDFMRSERKGESVH